MGNYKPQAESSELGQILRQYNLVSATKNPYKNPGFGPGSKYGPNTIMDMPLGSAQRSLGELDEMVKMVNRLKDENTRGVMKRSLTHGANESLRRARYAKDPMINSVMNQFVDDYNRSYGKLRPLYPKPMQLELPLSPLKYHGGGSADYGTALGRGIGRGPVYRP